MGQERALRPMRFPSRGHTTVHRGRSASIESCTVLQQSRLTSDRIRRQHSIIHLCAAIAQWLHGSTNWELGFAWTDWVGPISGDTDVGVRLHGPRILLDENGVRLECGREVRTATVPQRRALAVHDGGCAFPGCEGRRNNAPGHTLAFSCTGEFKAATRTE